MNNRIRALGAGWKGARPMDFYDLDMENWRTLDINVDSLWLIGERDKSGRHENVYHGNFIPQIPSQLIRRYTKENETVLDAFAGSGTTLFECEDLNRKFIGFDINTEIVDYVKSKMAIDKNRFFIGSCDVADSGTFENCINLAFHNLGVERVQ